MTKQESLKEGVLYAIFGNKKEYWKELSISLKSLKATNPDLKTCLVGNIKDMPPALADKIHVKIPLNEGKPFDFKLKTMAMAKSPFEKTLFLDLDTKVTGNLSEIFEFLRLYDIAIAYDPLCDWSKEDYFLDYSNKAKFNTGVVAYKKSPKMEQFFDIWLQSSIPDEEWEDQNNFNKIVQDEKKAVELGLKILELPNTVYNARKWIWKNMKEEGIRKRIKILHAHDLTGSKVVTFFKKVHFRLNQLKQA